MDRCRDNGIEHEWLDERALRQQEPYVVGRAAIFVPATGIVDYVGITHRMAELFHAAGGEVALGEEIVGLREEPTRVTVETTAGARIGRRVIVCAGLQSDRLAHLLGLGSDVRIIPFRGEYFRLRDAWSARFTHLIYPIPDPRLPFLGVHLTKMIDGAVTVGPSAVVGLAREGYRRFQVNARDAREVIGFRGFWLAMAPHLRSGLTEVIRLGFAAALPAGLPQVLPGARA